MRKNLVFHGFPTNQKSVQRRETWDECKTTLENHLEHSGLGRPKIDRAHRVYGRNGTPNITRSSFPIFAEFFSWQDASHVLRKQDKISRYTDRSGNELKIRAKQIFLDLLLIFGK